MNLLVHREMLNMNRHNHLATATSGHHLIPPDWAAPTQLSPIISLSEKLAAGPEVFERLKDNREGLIVKAILCNE